MIDSIEHVAAASVAPLSKDAVARQKKREYDILYRAKNKGRIAAFQATYRAATTEKRKSYARAYYLENREKYRHAASKRWLAVKNNPEVRRRKAAYGKEYNKRTTQIRAAKHRERYYNDVAASRAKTRAAYHSNLVRSRECARIRGARRRSTLMGKLNHRMSVKIQASLKANKSGRTWKSLVPYSVEELRKSIESKFTSGMSWKEFMAGEIHIDHIIPKSKFTYSSPDDPQFKQCWAIENLQPLWKTENISKGNRIISPTQIALGV